jgi:hypothetical protein
MFYAYVIRSSVDATYFYKGHCQDLSIRLAQQIDFLNAYICVT